MARVVGGGPAALSAFADVEAFARQHAACGGLTPSTASQPGGGYLLTLVCVCGATFDRWVTPEEAQEPVPPAPSRAPAPPPVASPPASAPAPPPSPPRPHEDVARRASRPPGAQRLTPSRELEEALRLALEAERPEPAPAPERPMPARETPPVAPSAALEEALRRAVTARQTPSSAARPAAPPARGVSRRDGDATVKKATVQGRPVDEETPRPSSRGFWIGTVLVLAAFAVAVAWYTGEIAPEPEAPPAPAVAPAPRPGTPGPAAPPAAVTSEADRAALGGVLGSLHQLQAISTPSVSYELYSTRVLFARADVDRFLRSGVPGEVKEAVGQVLDVHALAASAWKARILGPKASWDAVAQDPALDLCPSAKRVVDFAEQPPGQTRAQSRALAIANAIPLLWDCASAQLADAERMAPR